MFMDEIDLIGNRVSVGTKARGYAARHEDDYDEESNANSTCYDSERPAALAGHFQLPPPAPEFTKPTSKREKGKS